MLDWNLFPHAVLCKCSQHLYPFSPKSFLDVQVSQNIISLSRNAFSSRFFSWPLTSYLLTGKSPHKKTKKIFQWKAGRLQSSGYCGVWQVHGKQVKSGLKLTKTKKHCAYLSQMNSKQTPPPQKKSTYMYVHKRTGQQIYVYVYAKTQEYVYMYM